MALIVLGEDPARTGALQRQLEEELAGVAGAVVGALELAPRLAAVDAAPGDADIRERLQKLLAAAQSAYYEDRLGEIDLILGSIEALGNEVPGSVDPAQIFLWRAAVELARNNGKQAAAAARRALRLAPELVVDLEVFRPSVKSLVEEERRRIGKLHELALEVWPADAAVSVDARPMKRPVRLTAGEHVVSARRAGFRSVESDVRLPGSAKLRLALPLDLEAGLRQQLEATVWDGAAAAAVALRERLQVACLAVVALRSARGEGRAFIGCAGGRQATSEIYRVADAGGEEVGRFLTTALAPAGQDFGLRARASVGAARRVRRLTPEAGKVLSNAHSGAMGALDVDVTAPRGVLGRVELAAASYPTEVVVVHLGQRQHINGGYRWSGRAALGYAYELLDMARLEATVGGAWERQASADVAVDGRRLGIFPSYTSVGADLRIGGVVPVVESAWLGTVAVAGWAGISPWRQFREQPRGSTGVHPSVAASYSWQLEIGLTSRWMVALAYSGSLLEVHFSGVATAPYQPALTSTKMRELTHSLLLSAGF